MPTIAQLKSFLDRYNAFFDFSESIHEQWDTVHGLVKRSLQETRGQKAKDANPYISSTLSIVTQVASRIDCLPARYRLLLLQVAPLLSDRIITLDHDDEVETLVDAWAALGLGKMGDFKVIIAGRGEDTSHRIIWDKLLQFNPRLHSFIEFDPPTQKHPNADAEAIAACLERKWKPHIKLKRNLTVPSVRRHNWRRHLYGSSTSRASSRPFALRRGHERRARQGVAAATVAAYNSSDLTPVLDDDVLDPDYDSY